MENERHRLVGAPRFELGTSCAQASRATSWRSFLFNIVFQNKRVRKIFGSGMMCRIVAPHAWSPPNFPHSEREAKVYPACSSPWCGYNRAHHFFVSASHFRSVSALVLDTSPNTI